MNVTCALKKLNQLKMDNNLAAVSEVEAGIRDFVRNDVAYLRRPAPGTAEHHRDAARAQLTRPPSTTSTR